MCEKSKCRHRTEGLCSCSPVKNREDNLLALLEHMAVNMTDVHWELDYTDLNRPEKRRLGTASWPRFTAICTRSITQGAGI